jgi:hypothetical protein
MGCADVCLFEHYDGDNGPDFHATKTVTAKNTHQCVECRELIVPGQRYERTSGKWDGYMSTMRVCLVCAEIRDAFTCGSWIYGELWESVREEMFPVWRRNGAWDCLAKLTTPEAVAKCNAEYAAWAEDFEP